MLCEEAGRDPASLRFSVNLFAAEARAAGGRLHYYDDEDLFARLVGALVDEGFSDIGPYYPNDPDQIPTFEHLATDVIPELRR